MISNIVHAFNVIGVYNRRPMLGAVLVLACFYLSFKGVFDPVNNFSTPACSDTEGRALCLSTQRVMWHDLLGLDLLIC